MTERVISAKITRAGMRAMFLATNQGLKLNLAQIALGSGSYVPTGGEVALANEFTRVPIGGGEYITDFEMMVSALFADAQAGWISEVGLFDDRGTLFAVWSEDNAPIAYKSANTPIVIGVTLVLSEVPANSVSFVVGGPSVNITIAQPFSDIASAIIELQRRSLTVDVDRYTAVIVKNVASFGV